MLVLGGSEDFKSHLSRLEFKVLYLVRRPKEANVCEFFFLKKRKDIFTELFILKRATVEEHLVIFW